MVEKFGEFDMYNWSWLEYCKWLTIYFVSNNTAEDLKVTHLMSAVGSATSKLIVKLCRSSKPADMAYENIVQIVQDYYQSKTFIKEERQNFYQTKQNDRTIARYADILKKNALYCDFGEKWDERLQDLFLSGLRNKTIRYKLNRVEESLTFSELVSMASVLEEKKIAEYKKAEKKTEKRTSLKESAAEIGARENNTSPKEEKNAPSNNTTEKSAAYKKAAENNETTVNAVENKVAENEVTENKAVEESEAENNAAENNRVENNATENTPPIQNNSPANKVTEKSAVYKHAAKNKETTMTTVEKNVTDVTEKNVTENKAVEKNEAERNEAEINEADNKFKENNASDGDCADNRTAASREGTGGESIFKLRDYPKRPSRGPGPDRPDGGGKNRRYSKREFKNTVGQRSHTQETDQNIEMEDGEVILNCKIQLTIFYLLLK